MDFINKGKQVTFDGKYWIICDEIEDDYGHLYKLEPISGGEKIWVDSHHIQIV